MAATRLILVVTDTDAIARKRPFGFDVCNGNTIWGGQGNDIIDG